MKTTRQAANHPAITVKEYERREATAHALERNKWCTKVNGLRCEVASVYFTNDPEERRDEFFWRTLHSIAATFPTSAR